MIHDIEMHKDREADTWVVVLHVGSDYKARYSMLWIDEDGESALADLIAAHL